MSKTTPEEAIAIAEKYYSACITREGHVLYFEVIPEKLAALIDEVAENARRDYKRSMYTMFLERRESKFYTPDQHAAIQKEIQNQKEYNHELSGLGPTGNNPEQSGDTSLPIDMAPNEEDEAIRAKELPNIPWTGYLHPAPREDSDT